MTAATPLISVIVPCYNQAQYLGECLQSVWDQTYQNWECIIVNDGSPDNTEEIALQWTAKDPRFTYLKKENGGLSSARNAGIEAANGEWILPLDADDKIGKQYLELAEKEFGNGYTVIYCEAEFFGEICSNWSLQDYSFKKMLKGNLIFCSAFFKKSDWLSAGGYDLNLIHGREDWDFWIGILDKNSLVKRLDYLGFYYRRKNDSMDVQINAQRDKLRNSHNYIYKKHFDKYIEEFPNFFELLSDNNQLKKDNQKLLDLVNEPISKKIKRKFLK